MMKFFLFLFAAVMTNSFSSNVSYEGVSQEIKIGIVNPIEVYHRVPEGEQRIQNLQEKLKSQIEELQQESVRVKSQMISRDSSMESCFIDHGETRLS